MKYLFAFILLIQIGSSYAQHCPWCCIDCRIYIIKDLRYSPDTELKIYLLDKTGNVLKSSNTGDTIFFSQQKEPYKACIYTLCERDDLPRKLQTLRYSDFDSPEYYIAMIQGLNFDKNATFQLCILNVKSKETKIVPFPKMAVFMCISHIKIRENTLYLESDNLRSTYKENLFNYIKSK